MEHNFETIKKYTDVFSDVKPANRAYARIIGLTNEITQTIKELQQLKQEYAHKEDTKLPYSHLIRLINQILGEEQK